MTISYPLSLPLTNISNIRITARSVVGVSSSPFTGSQQVYKHQGQWWEAEVTLPPMVRADREAWIGFFLSLQGKYGTFYMGDPDAAVARGVATGSPLVVGAAQTGNELATDGWTDSTTGILKAGDYIQLGSSTATRMYKVMSDANSAGSGGAATLKIFPALRESPADNAVITVSACKCVWRLSSNETSWATDPCGISEPLTFAAIEAF